jgi:hypothetical protein
VQPKVTIPPLVQLDGSLAISNSEKANCFSENLSQTFTPHQFTNHPTLYENNVHKFLSSPLPMSLPAKPITLLEIIQIIKKLYPKKAPEYDLITNKLLKHLSKNQSSLSPTYTSHYLHYPIFR